MVTSTFIINIYIYTYSITFLGSLHFDVSKILLVLLRDPGWKSFSTFSSSYLTNSPHHYTVSSLLFLLPPLLPWSSPPQQFPHYLHPGDPLSLSGLTGLSSPNYLTRRDPPNPGLGWTLDRTLFDLIQDVLSFFSSPLISPHVSCHISYLLSYLSYLLIYTLHMFRLFVLYFPIWSNLYLLVRN